MELPVNNAAPNRWMVLVTVAFGTFMATLDSSIVNIALPTIRRELDTGDNVEWIVLSYLLVTTSTLLIMGRLSDMLGRKKIYILGFVVFTLGSLLCGLSWDLYSLVGFRIVQGLGASMIFANGPAIVSDVFPSEQRGQALGWIGTAVAAGASTGPVAGGLLLANFGWESIFYVNVPIGLIAIWRTWVTLPASVRSVDRRFDLPGALLFLVGVTSLLIGIDFAPDADYGWGHPLVIMLITAGVVLILAFLWWERRAISPMLHLGLFKIRSVSAALAAAITGFIASASNIYVLPFFLQLILNYDPRIAGFIMLAGPLTLSVAAPVGGYLSSRINARYISTVGLLISATGYLLLSQLSEHWQWHDVVWRTAMVSLGFGFFQSPNSSSALNAAPVAQRGIASSLLAFMRNLGQVFGISLGATIWYSVRNAYAAAEGVDPLSGSAQVAGMQWVYRISALLVLTGAFISFLRSKRPPAQPV